MKSEYYSVSGIPKPNNKRLLISATEAQSLKSSNYLMVSLL